MISRTRRTRLAWWLLIGVAGFLVLLTLEGVVRMVSDPDDGRALALGLFFTLTITCLWVFRRPGARQHPWVGLGIIAIAMASAISVYVLLSIVFFVVRGDSLDGGRVAVGTPIFLCLSSMGIWGIRRGARLLNAPLDGPTETEGTPNDTRCDLDHPG